MINSCKILLLLFFVGLQVQANLPHEFHFSKCQIEYKKEAQALQISLHLFIDDLELALEQRGHTGLFIGSEKEQPDAPARVYEYLQSSFQIIVNDTPVDYAFLGKETSEDLAGLWCYLEITDVSSIQSMQVKNSILTELYDDQKNVVQIKGPNAQKKYFLFHRQQKEQGVQF